MKNLALSALGKKARDGFCRCGSGASSSGASTSTSFSGSRDETCAESTAAKQASVNKLVRLLGEEVKSDAKVLFDHCAVGRSRRNASANIFCGLPSKGLRRLFAVYGIDEVQTKAPYESLDLAEDARRERQRSRQVRESRQPGCGGSGDRHQQRQCRNRARSAMDSSRRRLPAFAGEAIVANGRHC